MAARFAGGLTPLVWVLLTVYGGLSWREALWLFAGVAGVWCTIFWLWFRNLPAQHPHTNEAEQALISVGKVEDRRPLVVPWRRLLASRNLWAVCLMYTVTNFNWYFLMYYLPGALKGEYTKAQGARATGTDPLIPALLGGAPLLIGMLGCYLGGVLSDIYIRRTGDRKWGRRLLGMIGYAAAGLAYAAAATLVGGNFWLFASCLILVGLFNDLIMGPAWATTQDIGGRYSAIVGGSMNMIGNLGATLGNLITGLILKYNPGDTGFVICFTMYAAVYGLGVASWLLIDPTKPVVPEDPPGDSPPR
jgi:nitrate/nitrite transporter NarK